MTHTEATDMILRKADGIEYIDNPRVRTAILAAVATVMDAARAEAFEEAAKVADGWLEAEFDESANTMCQNICADIRARAKSHREPKP